VSTLDLAGDLGRRRRRGVGTLLVLLAVIVAGAVAWWLWSRPPPPDEAAEAFATAWDRDDPAAGPVDDPADTDASWTRVREGLGDAPLDVVLSDVTSDEDDDRAAVATLEVTWTLPGDREWRYTTTAPLARGDDGWRVGWSASVVHPDLEPDATLELRRTTPPRADVLAEDGTPLVTVRPVVDVGIQPGRVEDVDETVAAVRDVLDIELDGLEDRVEEADEDRFVPVVTLREDDYDDVAEELQPIPGTVFQRSEQLLAPTREFARATLGQAGPVTAELVEEDPDRYVAGDVAGLSGLQRRYDERLGGQPGLEVRAVPPDGTDGQPEALFTADPEPGEAVTVTLDEEVQRAADEALAAEDEFPTSAVVVRISDGHVLAVANGPAAGGLDLALTGRYPPGSTFKVATAAALLDGGLGIDDTVPCPATATVEGRAFSNAEDAELGDVPFREAFADSCNTAFVELTRDLEATALRDAAAALGVGHEPRLGVPADTGEVPETSPGTDTAASAIGQGRVLVSPFALADLVAAAARGSHLPPSLVLSPQPDGDPDEPEPDTGPEPAAEPAAAQLSAEVTEALAVLTRAVVTDGSGSALADVPGPPVHAKTGTAEYGDEQPPRTHAWVAGWQGDLAFAVLVAETPDAFGGQVAAPIAADLLARLAE
jgi:cell division protein FtsI/penicillin-binding protein 2